MKNFSPYATIIFIFCSLVINPSAQSNSKKEKEVCKIIEKFTEIISKAWREDELLKTIRMP